MSCCLVLLMHHFSFCLSTSCYGGDQEVVDFSCSSVFPHSAQTQALFPSHLIDFILLFLQAYLHSMSIIHRDLNSHNCLVKLVWEEFNPFHILTYLAFLGEPRA